MTDPESIGITQLAYNLAEHKVSVDDLNSSGQISSKPEVLKDFGFEYCYIHGNDKSFDSLILNTGKQLLDQSQLSSEDIDTLFLYSGLNAKHVDSPESNVLNLFKYPSFKIHNELNLVNANALTISQQGCSGLLSTINTAKSILLASDQKKIMCLTGDALPSNANREIMYNIMSDAAAGVILEKGAKKNQVIHFFQQTQSYYWDTPLHEQELLASYFPMAQRTILRCLEQAGLAIEDITWFVPHNVSFRSWKILAQLLNVSEDKIWNKNIKEIGHTVSCDHIINLVDMEKENVIKTGDYMVLFTFGFGANWSCLIIRH